MLVQHCEARRSNKHNGLARLELRENLDTHTQSVVGTGAGGSKAATNVGCGNFPLKQPPAFPTILPLFLLQR